MAKKNCGFIGRVLRIDLTNGTHNLEELDPKLYRLYMGGRNLGLYFLLKELPTGIDPLSHESPASSTLRRCSGQGCTAKIALGMTRK